MTATPTIGATKEDVKLMKLVLKADKEARQLSFINNVAGSPMFQVLATVAACELMEKENIISGGWSTAIEAGSVALVGLHALDRYGVLGVGVAGIAGLTGGALSGFIGNAGSGLLSNSRNTEIGSAAMNTYSKTGGGFPGSVAGLISMLWHGLFG